MTADDYGYVAQLPADIREIFMWLCQDVAWLDRKWIFYLGLFGKPENYAVMDASPPAFNLIEESLRTDMTMAICRLSDPIASCGRDNLNFRPGGLLRSGCRSQEAHRRFRSELRR